MDKLSELVRERGVLLADGATGSNLFEAGLQTGDSPELWNDEYPERIAGNYRSFIESGSDIILTNTFGGNRYRLGLHGSGHRVDELNFKAARIAREQVDVLDHTVLVGGSIGPTGEILEPLGSLSIQQAADAFAEQARALERGGADLLWIETMSSREEAESALIGTSAVSLPVVLTFSVDTNGRTMMGLSPSDIFDFGNAAPNRPAAIGVNCGTGAAETVAALVNIMSARRDSVSSMAIVVKANCGIPEYVDGRIVYSGTVETMSEYVKLAVDAGADIIGGCCGTTSEHVRSMRGALDTHVRGEVPDAVAIESRLGSISAGARAQLQGDLSIAGGAARPRVPRKSRSRRRR